MHLRQDRDTTTVYSWDILLHRDDNFGVLARHTDLQIATGPRAFPWLRFRLGTRADAFPGVPHRSSGSAIR